MEEVPGRLIDPSSLEFLRHVGTGQFASVELYRLNSEGSGNMLQVALKQLKGGMSSNKEALHQLIKEGRILADIQHRNIVTLLGIGHFHSKTAESVENDSEELESHASSTFIVEEYLNGGSLRDLVLEQMTTSYGRVYTDTQALEWMLQIAEALSYLHSQQPKVSKHCIFLDRALHHTFQKRVRLLQIMHRDLKLENILLRGAFGLGAGNIVLNSEKVFSTSRAKELWDTEVIAFEDGTSISGPSDVSARTEEIPLVSGEPNGGEERYDLTGVTGSYLYMAPEVFRSEPYNEKADVFSFGCIMAEVFSRWVLSTVVVGPTSNPNAARDYARKVANGFRQPLPIGLPLTLKKVIQNCYAQSPLDRTAMSEVLQKLAEIRASGVCQAMDEANAGMAFCERCNVM